MQSAISARYVLQSCTGAGAGAGACALVVLEIRERKRIERRTGVAVGVNAMDRYAWIIDLDLERESEREERATNERFDMHMVWYGMVENNLSSRNRNRNRMTVLLCRFGLFYNLCGPEI